MINRGSTLFPTAPKRSVLICWKISLQFKDAVLVFGGQPPLLDIFQRRVVWDNTGVVVQHDRSSRILGEHRQRLEFATSNVLDFLALNSFLKGALLQLLCIFLGILFSILLGIFFLVVSIV
ncbi:hypothetical protein HG530_014734 [Fusarium avenaceum]|nr:hypothetical protein HG530_014734 [Fusarium avenaceum]